MDFSERMAHNTIGWLEKAMDQMGFKPMDIQHGTLPRAVYTVGNNWCIFNVDGSYNVILSIIPVDPSKEITEHKHKYNGPCRTIEDFIKILNLLEIDYDR